MVYIGLEQSSKGVSTDLLKIYGNSSLDEETESQDLKTLGAQTK